MTPEEAVKKIYKYEIKISYGILAVSTILPFFVLDLSYWITMVILMLLLYCKYRHDRKEQYEEDLKNPNEYIIREGKLWRNRK